MKIFRPVLKAGFYLISLLVFLGPNRLFAESQGQQVAHPFVSDSLPPFVSRGGSGGASLKEDVSYLINPALLGFHTRSKGALFYSIKSDQQYGGASFLDRHTQIPLAVTWHRYWSHSFLKSDSQRFEAATGLKLLPWLAFGLKAKRQWRPSSSWNGGLGVAVRLQEGLGLALYGDPFLKEAKEDKRKVSGAFYYNWKGVFSLQGDASFSIKKEWIVRGGIESFFQEFFSLRLGGAWSKKPQVLHFSGGVTFQSQKTLLEYSLGLDKNASSWRHSATFLLRL